LPHSTFLRLPRMISGMAESDPQRLRQYVSRARAIQGLRDNTELAKKAGVAYRTLVNVLAGHSTRAEDAVELALGWGPGSIKSVLAGGEPDLTEQNSQPAPEIRQKPVGLGLDDAAADLTDEDIDDIRALIRAKRARRGLA
jgi:lambda repressor-like predicted transcriptional regulator